MAGKKKRKGGDAPNCCLNATEYAKGLVHGNYVNVNFKDVSVLALVDTGASISIICLNLLDKIDCNLRTKIRTGKWNHVRLADHKSKIELLGEISLKFKIGLKQVTHNFQVVDSMSYWAILGLDFLRTHNCILDYGTEDILFPNLSLESQNLNVLNLAKSVKPSIGAYQTFQNSIPNSKYPSDALICEAPREPHDMAYYQKAAIPKFSNYEDETEDIDFDIPTKPTTPLPVPLELSDSIFNNPQKDKLRDLIKKYRNAFAVDDTELGRTHLYVHKLRLKPGAQPPRAKLYQTNAKDREIIKQHINDMLKNKIIKPVSEGVFSSPTLLVPKKDGGLRFCADLREMNKILEEDIYPLPLIRDVLDALGSSKAKIFSIIDLRSAFWQIEVHPSSQKYLTINTHMGRYAFRVLPFGLHSSPSAFQRLMNTVLRGVLWEYAIPFLDDVVVYSNNADDHLRHLEEIFRRLQKAGLKLKPQKCNFGLNKIQYLGHNIGVKGLSPFQEKIRAVKEFKTPTSITQVKSFLGLANYYRKFIKDFSKLAKPLNDLTKKSKIFQWNDQAQKSFMELKRRLVTAPVLAHADPKLPFRLTTDASRTSLGWVLEQKQDGLYRVICYGGKSLTSAQSNYGVSDLEALAVVTAIKDLDCYLRYQNFTILTDHQPLKYMLTNPSPPPGRWSRWIALLSQYNFDVEYLKGSANRVADSLSRQKYDVTAPEEDDLESYLCSFQSGKESKGKIQNECYYKPDPITPLTKSQKKILKENKSQVNHIGAAKPTVKEPFFRTKNWVKHSLSKTTVGITRMNPSRIPADGIINFTTSQMKPVGPVSKSIQMAGGPDYRKSLEVSLKKHGSLKLGSIRKVEGSTTNLLWIYNVNLPKFQLGKKLAPNVVYKAILKTLESAANDGIEKIIISPTDLVSLDFSSTRSLEIMFQAIWDYCKDKDKPRFAEILIPIQTLSMAKKANNFLKRILKEPKKPLFQLYKEESNDKMRTKLLSHQEKTITDPDRLIKDLNLSKGFEELDYDIDEAEMKKLQFRDEYFGLLVDYLQNDNLPESEKIAKKIRKDAQNYELIRGILYNFWLIPKSLPFETRARFRLCVPAELRPRLMYAYHDTPISAHRGAEKMYSLMRLNYFWRGMFADIQNWTQSCVRCSKAKAMPKYRRAKLQPIVEHRPMGMINVDLIGPMQLCPEQYKYVLTMVDRATRYCFAVPIPDASAVTIAKAIFSEVISKFGLVDYLVSDRGLNFTSPVVQHLCSLLGTKRILTSAYRPSSNGLVESFNGVFKKKLLALAGEHPETWPQYVDGVLYALRTTTIESLGVSPYELLFGREPKLLLEIGPETLKTHPSKSVRRYMAELRTQLNYVSDEARKTEAKQKLKMKEEYDKRSKPYEYHEGDRVWIRSPQSTPGSTRKFRDQYIGPFILCTKTSDNTFKVRREGSHEISEVAIHADRYKPVISRYVKPGYLPGVVDEELTGPDIPQELIRESDYEDDQENSTENREGSANAEPSQEKSSITRPLKDSQDVRRSVEDKLQRVIDQLEQVTSRPEMPQHHDIPITEDADEFYPVDRIIRGKYTPEGVKYLIKWQGYSSRHNTWEKESDLSPDTLESLKQKPVRIFGRKPLVNTEIISNTLDETSNQVDLDPDVANNTDAIDKSIQDAYDADTEIDSDATDIGEQ